jgi:RNA polymerase sigma-70 factor (ECF subfamily)
MLPFALADLGTPPSEDLKLVPTTGDETAFQRACRGDEKALNGVLRELGPGVLSIARRVLGARFCAEAEDVAQDSLVALAQALNRIDDERALPAYAARITVRKAVRVRRRRQRDAAIELRDAPATVAADQERETHRRRQATALLALLDELPETQAEALFMRIALDKGPQEIAQTLDIPTNTVRSRIRLGRAAIKKMIAKRPQVRTILESSP